MSESETEHVDAPQETEHVAVADESSNTAEYLFRVVDRSIQMEEDRYASLVGTAGRLTTCVSILSVAAMGAVTLVHGLFSAAGASGALVAFCFLVFSALLASLALLLIACFRFSYKSLNCPNEFVKTVESYGREIMSKKEGARQYARQMNEVFEALRRRNDIVSKLVIAANITLMVSMALMLVFAIYGVAFVL